MLMFTCNVTCVSVLFVLDLLGSRVVVGGRGVVVVMGGVVVITVKNTIPVTYLIKPQSHLLIENIKHYPNRKIIMHIHVLDKFNYY